MKTYRLNEILDVFENKSTKGDENKRVVVKKYLKFDDKMIIISGVSKCLNDMIVAKMGAGDIMTQFEAMKVFNIMLAYTNIQPAQNELTTENIDRMFMCGLYDYIMNKCSKDYNRCVEYLMSALNFAVITGLSTASNDISADAEKKLEELKSFVESGEIKAVEDFMKFNNSISK